MMCLFLASLGVLCASGLAALLAGRRAILAGTIGSLGCVAGCAGAGGAALTALLGPEVLSIRLPWAVPMGSLYVELDPLSGLFALVTAGLCALCAIYGQGYMKHYGGGRRIGASWMFFNVLVASMLMVVAARNAVLFLVAWEVMSLASFGLVMFDDEQESVRHAGWTYLVATHLGTAFLLAMFLLLAPAGGLLDFDRLAVPGGSAGLSAAVFLMAAVGFGTKAGFFPLHVWLPEAHPAAPSHVSAVMSGVMIKTGIYGLLRVVLLLDGPAPWWGWVLIGVGAASGILGVLTALAQHDLKRLLAYHSVENIGIIALGLGVGMLGVSYGCVPAAVLGLAGGLMHVVNHAAFKGLLFMGAGAVAQQTGTREMDRLGGLMKRMGTTGTTFLVGSAAISGLPPLNGFVSELLIFLAALSGLTAKGSPVALAAGCAAVIGSLSMIGGLALACFAKAFGVIFLGEPRSPQADRAREAGLAMRAPMVLLAGTCAAIGLLGPVVLRGISGAAMQFIPATRAAEAARQVDQAAGALTYVAFASAGLVALAGALWLLRRRLHAGRQIAQGPTWDCGYIAPGPRMQYTASSFADPITRMFRAVLRPHESVRGLSGLMPSGASLHTDTPDVMSDGFYRPIFRAVASLAGRLRKLQQGRIQLYVLYIALTLLVLLLWKLG
jgi:formate hydrogenlyase subunit 3/multisubunit Na+/H+ antiporter MnhD subunit